MIFLLDSSALVKIYLAELRQDLVRERMAGAEIVAVSFIAHPEARAALAAA